MGRTRGRTLRAISSVFSLRPGNIDWEVYWYTTLRERLTEVSLYIDDSAWRRFRQQVFAKHGTLRKLSDEVESLICSNDIEERVAVGAKKLGISMDRVLTPADIKRIRPKLRGAIAETLVRQMRDQRLGGRLSRH